MSIIEGIFYGILQGITEFLPISSSGHLVFFNSIFENSCDFLFFSVFLHLATLFAVFVVLWKEVKYLLCNPFSKLACKIYLATIPTIIIVMIFYNFFKNAFSGGFLPVCFLTTAMLLLLTEILQKKTKVVNKEISNNSAFIIGLAQGIAVLPGISRSGATICTAILCGSSRENASKFSFLLSIPIIIASIIFEVIGAIFSSEPIIVPSIVLPSIFGFLFAFLVGILSIKFMLNLLQKIKLWYFSIYLVILVIIGFITGIF